MDQIGPNIKKLRLERNITQELLAAQLCVTPQAVSRWETQQSLPDIAMLPAIAYFFGTTIDELFAYRAEDAKEDVAKIQSAFYRLMDSAPEQAEQLLRDGLKKYPGNEALLVDLLYLLKPEDRYEERISLCRRLLTSENPAVRFRAKCVLAKSYRCQGHYDLAKQLLEELPYFEYSSLEIRALVLDGDDSFQAAQREKVASLSRLISMLQVIAAHYAHCGQTGDAAATIHIAQAILDAFQTDIPYQFPANDTATQTYTMFEPERTQLAALAKTYAG